MFKDSTGREKLHAPLIWHNKSIICPSFSLYLTLLLKIFIHNERYFKLGTKFIEKAQREIDRQGKGR